MFAKPKHKHIDMRLQTPLLSVFNWIRTLEMVLIFKREWGKEHKNFMLAGCFNGLINFTFY